MVATPAGNTTALLLAIPTKQEIANLAATIPTSATNPLGYSHGPRTILTLGAGVIRIRKTDQAKTDAARVARIRANAREITSLVREGDAWLNEPMALVQTSEDFKTALLAEHPELRGMTGVARSRITMWTRASKNRMQLVLAQLDYSPLFEAGNIPAMVTLTMPGQYWQDCAPTPGAFKKLVVKFQARYEEAFGERPVGVWKMEFQKRGAPHLHILMTPPAGTVRRPLTRDEETHVRVVRKPQNCPHVKAEEPCGHSVTEEVSFRAWLSQSWALTVGVDLVIAAGTTDAFNDHVRAGTGIDYPEGQRYNDPKRIAQYFSKHGAYLAKDYQNDMPAVWLEALEQGAGGARFWGYWGLEKAIADVELRATPPVACEFEGITGIISATWEAEQEASWATDKSVLRAWFRDNQGGKPAADAVVVERHLRKLARSMAAERGRTFTSVKGHRYRPIVQTTETLNPRTGEFEQHGAKTAMRRRTQERWVTVDAGSGWRNRTVRDSETGNLGTVSEFIEWDAYRVLESKQVVGYYQGGSGYLVVNDGRVTGTDIMRLLTARSNYDLTA